MKFCFSHNNINVSDLQRSLDFYQQALGLREKRRREKEDGSFTLVFLTDGISDWQLELTCLKDHPQPYDLGENEVHFCLTTDDYEGALAKHREMGCVCFENPQLRLYFIEDPDGYWVEIVPEKRD
ncbi:MAG: VOC family protein [Clostridiales bacterium]|nr:VOC family protein [Clostridiales bacterium]